MSVYKQPEQLEFFKEMGMSPTVKEDTIENLKEIYLGLERVGEMTDEHEENRVILTDAIELLESL